MNMNKKPYRYYGGKCKMLWCLKGFLFYVKMEKEVFWRFVEKNEKISKKCLTYDVNLWYYSLAVSERPQDSKEK